MSAPTGFYEHRAIDCPYHKRTDDQRLKRLKDCTCLKRVWVDKPTKKIEAIPGTKTGKITAMASTKRPGTVEIIMSDGEDAAITYMSPEKALTFCMDIMAAANQATR